ncbi:MAG: hypothetical protein WA130_19585, partial [Candidatus Methanoperedens sp.]
LIHGNEIPNRIFVTLSTYFYVGARMLYSSCKNVVYTNRIDRINSTTNPVNPVQTVASFSAAPDSPKILHFISARLSAAPEESDVVHHFR